MGQGLALSLILLALYLAPFLHILEKHLKNLNLQVSLLSFINDGLLIPQSKSFETSNSCLYCSYNVALNLLTKFSFLVEHSKTKVSHFSRLQEGFSPPPLDLSPLGRPSLSPKDSWCYLGFIFYRKLLFYNYIDFYTNKAISIVKCIKILGNSTKELNPHQEFLPYKSYAMPIALYSFQLWYYNKTPLSYPLRILNKMQRRAALWIVGTFKMSPLMGVEAITGLIPINLHLQKIGGRSQLRVHLLLSNHILWSLMSPSLEFLPYQHILLLNSLTRRQHGLIKDHIIDMENHFNKVLLSFDPINPKFFPSSKSLTLMLIIFLFIFLTSTLAITSNITFKNPTKQLLNLWTSHLLHLLLQMPTLRTILLCPLHIFTFMTNLSQKLSIML